MKYNSGFPEKSSIFLGGSKIFRTLALVIVLSLLVIAIPATPVLAAVSLSVSPTSGEVGDKITVTGSAYTTITKVYIYFSSDKVSVGKDIEDDLDAYEEVNTKTTDSLGALDTYFYVPERLTDGDTKEDVHGGTYYVYTAYSDDKILTVNEFTVRAIELYPTQGNVGDEIEISGVGFSGNRSITVKYDGSGVNIASGDDKTDSKGKFELTIEIPPSTAGVHTISVKAYDEVEAEFTVEPKITIVSPSPPEGSIGDEITVDGTGFSKTKDVTIYFNDVIMTLTSGTARTDSDGSFDNLRFNVPAIAAGTYNVKAKDAANKTDTAVFTIICNAEIDPITGHVGTTITVSGDGFIPGGTATIKYDGTEVATAPIGTDGAFEATFDAPASTSGAHTVKVSDVINTKNITFTMESTPPSTVYALLPLMDSNLRGWKFDWGGDADDPTIEVTDDSLPITYTLQIAPDIGFAVIALEKTGLTTSEYTVTTKEEKELLKPSTKQAPYYWHVKAIDAASNETDWTETRTFYVGFTWPNWATYTLIGLGGLLLLALSFWLGRRTAYY